MDFSINLYEKSISTILLLGPPGAGKGTLGRALDYFGTQKFVSSGCVLRSLDPDSAAGQLYDSYARQNQLVPDEVVLPICHHYIQGLIASNQFFPMKQDLLLEGLPRTVQQATSLMAWISVKHIIVLECFNKDNLRKRLHRRARAEGKFNIISEEEFDRLFIEYEQESQAILALFPKHQVTYIEADQRPLEVLKDVLSRLVHILSEPPVIVQ